MKTLKPAPRGSPLMLEKLDKMMQDYLRAIWKRSSVTSKCAAISVANALIKRLPEMNLDIIDFNNSEWARSLFQRMRTI